MQHAEPILLQVPQETVLKRNQTSSINLFHTVFFHERPCQLRTLDGVFDLILFGTLLVAAKETSEESAILLRMTALLNRLNTHKNTLRSSFLLAGFRITTRNQRRELA